MPELPEVEVVRRALAPQLEGQQIVSCVIHQAQLRWPVPADLPVLLKQQPVLEVSRRSKYLLWTFPNGVLLLHFGMTGKLRWDALDSVRQTHDHLTWHIGPPDARPAEAGLLLQLNDSRRFGAALWHPAQAGPVANHPRLAGLAIEPFDDAFDGAHLYRASRSRQVAIKTFLLAGQGVVGVGNIYASESLFRAGIHPATSAQRISLLRYQRLAEAIRQVLTAAIAAGGSSLRDYAAPGGELGAFQTETCVYGREGLACRVCGQPIKRIVQAQRSTFYCAGCQH